MLYMKLVWMWLTAVCTATFVYPFLHELGHLLAAILTGSRIVEFSVFPTSYVMMETVSASAWRTVVVGLCGMIFPMLCALVHPRHLTMSVIIYTIQLSLLGCKAVVKVGNSLTDPFVPADLEGNDVWYTPMYTCGKLFQLMSMMNNKEVSDNGDEEIVSENSVEDRQEVEGKVSA